jgi:2-phosphosulfolactate phosphatase
MPDKRQAVKGWAMTPQVFCEWDRPGVLSLRQRVRVIVIVDVLSFSTCVDIAVSRGAEILPFPYGDRAAAQSAADAAGAILAGRRGDASGVPTLSPSSLLTVAPGTRLMLPSPNGSRLSLNGRDAIVLAGCLRNASAVARAACSLANGGGIGVIPAGERWPDGSLRPAIEDWLGAGAIISAIDLPVSAEASVAQDAYRSTRATISETVHASMSGQELIGRGFPDDVRLAVELDASVTVPRLVDGRYKQQNPNSQ